MARIRVGLAQLDCTVGDLDGNADRVLRALREGADQGCDVVITPELALVGYPPEDLLLKDGFVEDAVATLEKVAAAAPACLGVVGTVLPADPGLVVVRAPDDARDVAGAAASVPHRHLANAAALVGAGRLHGAVAKRRLPNYAVFDEERWFLAGAGDATTVLVSGSVGVAICEDVWVDRGPAAALAAAGAGLICVCNASPYFRGRQRDRLDVLRARATETGCAFASVNMVGGQDELVFDGGSTVVDATGAVVAAAAQFEEALLVVDVDVPDADDRARPVPGVSDRPRREGPARAGTVAPHLEPSAEVYAALVTGTRDYLVKNGFTRAVVALSGGIDSSLVATIAVDAVGADQVVGISMPSRYSSAGSVDDAMELARRLGIRCVSAPIDLAHMALARVLVPVLGGEPTGLTDENLQSRIRGVVLMAVSNATGAIVLTTGNKSEIATGYTTLYGDSVGGFAVIKDVVKTLVYELCRWRNADAVRNGMAPPIPDAVLEKPPSAELRPDQLDADSLPPYEELDPILEAYVEGDRTAAELVAAGHDAALVERVCALVDIAEYKRRQLAPGVRITSKAFGKDRRLPITNRYGAARQP